MGAKYVFNPLTGNLDTTDVVAFNGEVNLGTAAAPSVFFTGDSNTGIYSPGADQLAISTNGTGRLFVDASGKVGLGTSAPNLPLTVAYSDTSAIPTNAIASPSTGSVQIFNTSDSANYSGIYLQTRTTGASAALMGLRYNTSFSDGDIFFRLRNGAGTSIEPLTIKSSGNVGIGTTSPGVALHVDGDIRCDGVYGETDTNTSIQFPGSDVITFNEGGSEAARIDSDGRLLVGTSSSSTASSLVIAGTSSGDAYGIARICSTSSTPSNGDLLGLLSFGDSSHTNAAWIRAERDGGTWTSGSSMPGRLVFSVTADGASSPTEAMRIKNTRVINFSNAPVYADNAAAKTGGLVDGDVYRTSTGDLKIVYT